MNWIQAINDWVDREELTISEAARLADVHLGTMSSILAGERAACSKSTAKRLAAASGIPLGSIPLPIRGILPCGPQRHERRRVEGHDGSRVILRVGARYWRDDQPQIDEATTAVARLGLADPWVWPTEMNHARRLLWWKKRRGQTAEVYWIDAKGNLDTSVKGYVHVSPKGIKWIQNN